ncbi:MAG: FYDLN acid domain-containing protein [candidate division Zixibacteria bacterium]|nr:FYDLN acid domain-containing protein [candidate division Zixibacteria bacterium]
MPRGDGTGPTGQGPGTGRGSGMGCGQGRGRMGGNRPGAGVGGSCVCPSCGAKTPHQAGTPCYDLTCPKCGNRMVRE